MDNNPFWFRERQACLRRKPTRLGMMRGFLPLWWVPQVIALLWYALISVGRDLSASNELWDMMGSAAMVSCYLQILWVSVRAVLAGASALSRERDLQTLEVLTCSPMSVPSILRAKWLAMVAKLWLELAVTAPWSLLLLLDPHRPWSVSLMQALNLYLIGFGAVVFYCGLSLSQTLSAKRKRSSVVAWGILMISGFIPFIGPLVSPVFATVGVFAERAYSYDLFVVMVYLLMSLWMWAAMGQRRTLPLRPQG